MPRKGHVAQRKVLPDPIYNSTLVTRLINSVMLDGKKGVAQQIIYGAFDRVSKATGRDPLEVRSRRVGGANYQVPVEVREARRYTLGLRWLTNYARLRNEKTMEERLAKEIMDAANGVGGAVKKREDTHRMAEANKAFAHYQW